MPAHHRAAASVDAYIDAGGLEEPKAALFQSMEPTARRLTGRALERRVILAMIKRRAAAAGLPPSTCCHTLRATGLTASLSNGGTREHAQQIARYASPKTTKLYDRTADTVPVDEIQQPLVRYHEPAKAQSLIGKKQVHQRQVESHLSGRDLWPLCLAIMCQAVFGFQRPHRFSDGTAPIRWANRPRPRPSPAHRHAQRWELSSQ